MNETIEQFVQTLRRRVSPGCEVHAVDNTTIEICVIGLGGHDVKQRFAIDLGRFYSLIPALGLKETISAAVEATIEAIESFNFQERPLSREMLLEQCRVIIRSSQDFLLRTVGGESRIHDVYHVPLDRDTVSLYVIDYPQLVIPIDYNMMIDLKVSPAEVQRRAYANTKALLSTVQWRFIAEHTNLKLANACVQGDSAYSPSLVLFEEFWVQARSFLGGDPVAVIPLPDVLVVGTDMPETRRFLRRFAEAIITERSSTGYLPVSYSVWEWSDGHLQKRRD